MRQNQLAEITLTGNGAWVRDAYGIQWAYSGDLNGGVHGLEFGLEHENVELQLLQRCLRPGGVFFDIGANIGFFSIRMACWVPHLTAYAFEPVKSTFNLLKRNIARKCLEASVSAYQIALSDREGEVDVTSDLATGNYVLTGALHPDRTLSHESVRQTTVDVFVSLNGIRHVDLIKCDVEGAELLVMRGAENTLKGSRPILLLEIEDRWTSRYGYEPDELFQYLKTLGYSYSVVTYDGRIQPSSSSIQDDLLNGRNFLFHQFVDAGAATYCTGER